MTQATKIQSQVNIKILSHYMPKRLKLIEKKPIIKMEKKLIIKMEKKIIIKMKVVVL